MSAFWLSFCDTDRPKGQQFLGACIIPQANSLPEALRKAWGNGINPGGEVASVEFDNSDPAFSKWPRLKLISREEFSRLEAQP